MEKLLMFTSLLIGLAGFSQKKNAAVPAALLKCWSASYEENKEPSNEKIYRTCEHVFPASRFRQSIIFDKNGTCKVLHLGEADAHYYVDCKYNYNKKNKTVNIGDADGKVKMKFRIVFVEKDMLKIIFEE